MAAVARVQLSPLCVAARSVVMDPPRARQAEEIEHDLFGKPVPTHRVMARGHAFRDHACDDDRENQNNGGICATLSGPRNTAPLTKRSGNDRASCPPAPFPCRAR